MQYTKPMIELVYEIRKIVPSDMKPGVKLANPDLFSELIDHYYSGAKTVTKALIKELLTLAGENWLHALNEQQKVVEKHHTKMYRGIVSLEEKTPDKKSDDASFQKKRIYRGQVIA